LKAVFSCLKISSPLTNMSFEGTTTTTSTIIEKTPYPESTTWDGFVRFVDLVWIFTRNNSYYHLVLEPRPMSTPTVRNDAQVTRHVLTCKNWATLWLAFVRSYISMVAYTYKLFRYSHRHPPTTLFINFLHPVEPFRTNNQWKLLL
jgi:hypothetical protein